MKNPLKPVGDALKSMRDKFVSSRKKESARAVVDGVGDSGIIGGIAMLGTAAFLPAAPATMLAAGALFIAIGGAAKFVASKMKPGPFDVTKPQAEAEAPVNDNAPGLKAQSPAPGFKIAADAKKATPAATKTAKPGLSPKP